MIDKRVFAGIKGRCYNELFCRETIFFFFFSFCFYSFAENRNSIFSRGLLK